MRDRDGPDAAKVFYDQLFKNERLDLDDIPYALDEAIRQLRDGGAPAEGWAAFVHMGG
jgi:adenine specific DNA methylase Mod